MSSSVTSLTAAPPAMPSSLARGDMRVNNLVYKQPERVSLAVNRTMKRQNFERASYASDETAIIRFNTGSDYVRCSNSYLTFEATAVGSTPVASFGVGSAMNFVDSIKATTRSGTSLDTHEKANLWSAKTLRHKNSQDWVNNYGSMMGMGTATSATLTSTPRRFIIPLSKLIGLFDPVGGVDMPPNIAAGLELQIQFADFRKALLVVSGTVTGYSITKMSIMTDLVTLSQPTQKTLNFEAAQSGLEYVYPRWHQSTSNVKSTAISVQVAKAVAQASMMYGCLVNQGEILNVTKDSFKSVDWDVGSWQARVGSLYYPSEVLSDPRFDGVESFFMAQSVYDKNKFAHAENAISVDTFKSGGEAVFAASFERDQALNLTGTTINNSRQVELNATLGGWTVDLELTLFLEYFAVCRAFIDNAAVSI